MQASKTVYLRLLMGSVMGACSHRWADTALLVLQLIRTRPRSCHKQELGRAKDHPPPPHLITLERKICPRRTRLSASLTPLRCQFPGSAAFGSVTVSASWVHAIFVWLVFVCLLFPDGSPQLCLRGFQVPSERFIVLAGVLILFPRPCFMMALFFLPWN